MATMAASPPAVSPPPGASHNKQPLPASLARTRSSNSRRISQQPRMSANVPTRRVSSRSSASHSIPPGPRPISTSFPAFDSTLSYALVRDFAYPWTHPMHYGPQPNDESATPVSERRLSDPEVDDWEESRSSWSSGPPWMSEDTWSSSKDQLPASTYSNDGPPYREDDDLRSPVVVSSRHRKRSDRGRSPGREISAVADGDRIEQYHPTNDDVLDGPGGEIETFTRKSKHRDSNFAKPLQREQFLCDDKYGHVPEEYNSDEDVRYSKDYSFTIVSSDEEMHGKAVALFDFASEHVNELALREGQIILVSYRHGQGWLVAEDPVTGESGLVPEEFVRLERHIEGGLNGFDSIEPEDDDASSPTSNDGGSASTPTETNDTLEKQQPAVQSTFSTSTKDFSLKPPSI